MVNEINLAKWIAALRSPKFRQGRGQLCDDDNTMCCLGVLCEISGLGTWEGRGPGRSYVVGRDGRSSLPPYAVLEWAGLSNDNPYLATDTTCSGANDREHWAFSQIADALETRYLPGKKAEEILAGAK